MPGSITISYAYLTRALQVMHQGSWRMPPMLLFAGSPGVVAIAVKDGALGDHFKFPKSPKVPVDRTVGVLKHTLPSLNMDGSVQYHNRMCSGTLARSM